MPNRTLGDALEPPELPGDRVRARTDRQPRWRYALPVALRIGLAIGAVALPLLGVRYERSTTQAVAEMRIATYQTQRAITTVYGAESAVRDYAVHGDHAALSLAEERRDEFREITEQLRPKFEGDVIGATYVDHWRSAFEDWNTLGASSLLRIAESQESTSASRDTGVALVTFNSVVMAGDTLSEHLDGRLQAAINTRANARILMLALLAAGILCAFMLSLSLHTAVRAGERADRRLSLTRTNLRDTREALEQERSLSAQRGDMLSVASHDLRSPLTGLLLSADYLRMQAERDGNAEYADLSQEMVDAARRTTMLLSDLLDHTRIEAGRVTLSRTETSAEALIDEAIADVLLGRPGQAFDIRREVVSDLLIHGDEARLRAVIRNLLENALRYGQAPYRVRILDSAPLVEIHVEDSGKGIPDDERETIFDRFCRGSTATNTEGTGIGLHLVRNIIELHGGHVDVGRSALGGANFIVRLPKAA